MLLKSLLNNLRAAAADVKSSIVIDVFDMIINITTTHTIFMLVRLKSISLLCEETKSLTPDIKLFEEPLVPFDALSISDEISSK